MSAPAALAVPPGDMAPPKRHRSESGDHSGDAHKSRRHARADTHHLLVSGGDDALTRLQDTAGTPAHLAAIVLTDRRTQYHVLSASALQFYALDKNSGPESFL